MKNGNILDIDWDKVKPIFKFAAMNENGAIMLFTERPEMDVFGYSRVPYGGWRIPGTNEWGVVYAHLCGIVYTEEEQASLKASVNWEESLIERDIVRPKVTNALNIDWDEVDPGFNFAAMHFTSKGIMLFTEKPILNDSKEYFGFWKLYSTEDYGTVYLHDGRSLLKDEDTFWRNTLTERPVKVE